MPFPARLAGTWTSAVLARTLAEILRRHEALRTTFATVDGVPAQVVAPAVRRSRFRWRTSRACPRRGRRRRGGACSPTRRKTPFELESGPLLRTSLVRMAESEHLLLLDMHHIVSDGWSMGIYFNELSSLYEAFRSRAAVAAAGAGHPICRLCRLAAASGSRERCWRNRSTTGATSSPGARRRWNCPRTGCARRSRPTAGPSRWRSCLRSLTLALRELSRREGASMFMTLLAGFNLLLSRLAGQEDVVVGSPSAGRRRMETEGLIGLFLNTLVLRTGLAGDPTFRELLGRVKTVGAWRLPLPGGPFEKLLEELQPERLLSRRRFSRCCSTWSRLRGAAGDAGPADRARCGVPEPDSKFDFTFYLQERGDIIHVNVVYNADLFDAVRIEELLRQFEHVLAQGVANPGERSAPCRW